jgi:(E)-4-hydroxy-3-methylbut-2-enyl-diphosphate synthase
MRDSRVILVGGFDHVKLVSIGGDLPVVIQTMWKDRVEAADLEGGRGEALVARIGRLGQMGCDLVRFAVPDLEAADVLGRLAQMVSMPLVADIHFDHKIALRCMDFPIAKIRINPGNIGSKENVEKVLSKAGAKGVPIRIGVNAGSLPADLRERVERGEIGRVEAVVETAERELAVFDEFGFSAVCVSVKASSAADTIGANRLLRERTDAPLHVGVTEAGPLVAGVVRNTVALCSLLGEGIGDTVRVSLSDTVENEVIAAREILDAVAETAVQERYAKGRGGGEAAARGRGAAGYGGGETAAGSVAGGRRCGRCGVTIVSCPRCGRNSFDTHAFTEKWLPALYGMRTKATVAIMGCVVNGPGEGKHADLGITGAGDKVLLFRHGEVVRTVDAKDADAAFGEEIEKLGTSEK